MPRGKPYRSANNYSRTGWDGGPKCEVLFVVDCPKRWFRLTTVYCEHVTNTRVDIPNGTKWIPLTEVETEYSFVFNEQPMVNASYIHINE